MTATVHSLVTKSKDGADVHSREKKKQPFFAPAAIQRKLLVGSSDDPAENEADTMSGHVMSMKVPDNKNPFFKPAYSSSCQRQSTGCKEEEKKPANENFSDLIRHDSRTYGARTDCDVKVHPEDETLFLLKKDFRTIGSGSMVVTILDPQLAKSYPCMLEITLVHEEVHKKNSAPFCKNFKKCVDDHSSKVLGLFGNPTISYKDYVNCHNNNSGGKMKDCKQDEKLAYEAMIKKAEEILKESRCKKEKALILTNLNLWKNNKDNPPNCLKK